MLMTDNAVLFASHTFITTSGIAIPAFTHKPQNTTALWPELIFRLAGVRRLGGWLHIQWFICHHLSTYWA